MHNRLPATELYTNWTRIVFFQHWNALIFIQPRRNGDWASTLERHWLHPGEVYARVSERLRIFFFLFFLLSICIHSHFTHNMAMASLTCPTWWYFTVSGAINKRHRKSSEATSSRQLHVVGCTVLLRSPYRKWTVLVYYPHDG